MLTEMQQSANRDSLFLPFVFLLFILSICIPSIRFLVICILTIPILPNCILAIYQILYSCQVQSRILKWQLARSIMPDLNSICFSIRTLLT